MTINIVASHTFGFDVSTGGFVYNFNGAGAPSVGQWDILFVNSDATIDTPLPDWTRSVFDVGGEGVYAFTRKAIGGEAATVTIITPAGGGAPRNATLGWVRLDRADGLDNAVFSASAGGNTTTAPLSSGQLAGSTEIALAYAGLHSFNPAPNTPVWGDSFTPLGSATKDLGGTAVACFLGQRNGVGTPAVNPVVTWTNNAVDRVMLLVTFTEIASCPPCPPCPPCPDCPPGCGPITGDDPAFAIATALLECAYSAVDHTGDLVIKRRCVVPGEIAWDSCECGQLVITEDRRYGSRLFPLEEVDHNAECGEPFLVVALRVSLVRCVPGVRENGEPPACSALQTAAQQLMKDKRDLRSAVMCCLTQIYDAAGSILMGFEIGAQESVGPAGQCAGSELTVLLGFANPCDC